MKIITKSCAVAALAALAPWMARAESATDKQIETTAKNTYNLHVVLNDKVKVESKDGDVTLTGTVQDNNQKQLAEDTVNELPNVHNINDQITVDSPGAAESDGWISFKIHSMLLMKPYVSSTDTHVDVKDGAVTLSGMASSAAQKELTETYVKDVDGVKSVTDNLQVQDRTYTDDQGRSVKASGMDDASITAQIKWALATHSATSALKTKVQTEDGVVTVSGDADSDAEKALVSRLVEDVRGVKTVNNEMSVR